MASRLRDYVLCYYKPVNSVFETSCVLMPVQVLVEYIDMIMHNIMWIIMTVSLEQRWILHVVVTECV